MKKILISLILIAILIIGGIFYWLQINKKESNNEIAMKEIEYVQEENNQTEEEKEKINDIAENQGLQAEKEIYEIETEFDGREVIVVKDNIQYKVALAGILKNKKPEIAKLDELLEDAPKHTGIWIEKNSREKFLEILKKITSYSYQINEQGFLVQNIGIKGNQQDKVIKTMLSDSKLHVFAIKSTSYLVDSITGEIEEYPYEEMDPYTGYEYFESNDKDMFIISENIKGKINQEEVLKEILEK